MKILLTGATGFIGKQLVSWLLAQQEDIITCGRHANSLPGVTHLQVSPFTIENVTTALQDLNFDACIHLAAAGVHPTDRNSDQLIQINSVLPATLVAAAARAMAKAVIIVGSSAEYQQPPANTLLTENDPLEMQKLYGATKAAGSLLSLAQAHTLQIPTAVIRLFNVFGYGEAPHRLLPSLINGLLVQQPVKLSVGTQVRDFVYVKDVCKGLYMSLNALIRGTMTTGVYHLATGVEHSVAYFCKTTARLLKQDEKLLAFGSQPMRPDDLPYVVGSASSLQHACGWQPDYTLTTGLQDAINDYLTLSNKGVAYGK
ncbi:MAG: NAD-dependent epimerase/dehydratase family protein [Legionellales bacterium]|nr:NAD-dependent epimerase/dehydratase family protein [Legionellales bacterium]